MRSNPINKMPTRECDARMFLCSGFDVPVWFQDDHFVTVLTLRDGNEITVATGIKDKSPQESFEMLQEEARMALIKPLLNHVAVLPQPRFYAFASSPEGDSKF